MLETTQTVLIHASRETAWNFVSDIRRWASLMPGCRECLPIDANNSRWILKVGAGALVRTVKVLVRVDRWDAPERVDFSFQFEGDPVKGGGAYSAAVVGPHETAVSVNIRIAGSGLMAPMWEAISKPLLPLLARSFAEKLTAEIERFAATREVGAC